MALPATLQARPVELDTAGMTCEWIADELGLAKMKAVLCLVQTALTPDLQEDVETPLATQASRFEGRPAAAEATRVTCQPSMT